jgi:hypothetical protein
LACEKLTCFNYCHLCLSNVFLRHEEDLCDIVV